MRYKFSYFFIVIFKFICYNIVEITIKKEVKLCLERLYMKYLE